MANNSTNKILRMACAAICLALALALPFLTGQIPVIGKVISPMHIPVFLCGFICGGPWGAAVGFIAPILRFIIFGMPKMPTCISMAFELAAYGFVSGIAYKLLPKKPLYIYVSLVIAMLCGRAVMGVANVIIAGVNGGSYTMSAFIAAAFINALPGIIIHLILVPVIVIALKKAGLVQNK